jgi:hypothetical protein
MCSLVFAFLFMNIVIYFGYVQNVIYGFGFNFV